MKMKEIKKCGLQKRKNDNRNYQYSLFACDLCGNEVVRRTWDGLNQKHYSHKCYASNRSPRGAYKEKVESGYVAEHRLVAKRAIGRHLRDYEVAHHINGDKHDNRPSNIEVMTASEHSKYHANNRKRLKDGSFY